MGGINVGRWLAGGIVASLIIFVIEGATRPFYADTVSAVLQAHNLSFEMSAQAMVWAIIMCLLLGFALVFFYVLARPRLGPGPRTAVIVAVALFLASYGSTLIGYHMIGLYSGNLLAMWAVQGLVEMIIAAVAG